MRRTSLYFGFVLFGLVLSCGEDEPTNSNIDPGPRLTIAIEHMVDGDPLTLGSDLQTADGTTVQISKLRYWISNVQLHHTDGSSHTVPASYYLLEQTLEKTRNEIIIGGIPAGEYTGLSMAVGVDEGHNHSIDLFEGELSAALNMDWGWNSGFIFFKIEGEYANNGSMSAFQAHVGKDALYREVSMTFDAPMTIDAEHDGTVQLAADVKSIFDGWDVPAVPDIIGGAADSPAGTVAANYAQWFSLQSATSQE